MKTRVKGKLIKGLGKRAEIELEPPKELKEGDEVLVKGKLGSTKNWVKIGKSYITLDPSFFLAKVEPEVIVDPEKETEYICSVIRGECPNNTNCSHIEPHKRTENCSETCFGAKAPCVPVEVDPEKNSDKCPRVEQGAESEKLVLPEELAFDSDTTAQVEKLTIVVNYLIRCLKYREKPRMEKQ